MTDHHGDTEAQSKTFGQENKISEKNIKSAVEVHRNLGPGLLESVYEGCPCHEFELNNINYERQKELPVIYKNKALKEKYRIDIIVEEAIILEIKCVETILPVHEAQLLTYLKLTNKKIGLILNFYSETMIKGIKRIVL
jgi:GxxExxY protein